MFDWSALHGKRGSSWTVYLPSLGIYGGELPNHCFSQLIFRHAQARAEQDRLHKSSKTRLETIAKKQEKASETADVFGWLSFIGGAATLVTGGLAAPLFGAALGVAISKQKDSDSEIFFGPLCQCIWSKTTVRSQSRQKRYAIWRQFPWDPRPATRRCHWACGESHQILERDQRWPGDDFGSVDEEKAYFDGANGSKLEEY